MSSRSGRVMLQIRLVLAVLVAVAIGMVGGYGLARARPFSAVPASAQADSDQPDGAPDPTPSRTRSPGASPAGATEAAGQATPADPADVPRSGSGRFVVAPGTGRVVGGGGRLVRYRAVVEAEAPVEPAVFGQFVEQVLADPRGWSSAGLWRFQRVDGSAGSGPVDFTVHLATPATTDRICGSHGLSTQGEVSCRGGADVVINLKRWMLGVPWYADALTGYRTMVVSHEIGHYLGYGHATCPGTGQVAPVMQTQTAGLDGCVRNPWPYPAR